MVAAWSPLPKLWSPSQTQQTVTDGVGSGWGVWRAKSQRRQRSATEALLQARGCYLRRAARQPANHNNLTATIERRQNFTSYTGRTPEHAMPPCEADCGRGSWEAGTGRMARRVGAKWRAH